MATQRYSQCVDKPLSAGGTQLPPPPQTCIIATVSPVAKFAAETQSTLQFAARAKLIRNKLRGSERTDGTNAKQLSATVQAKHSL